MKSNLDGGLRIELGSHSRWSGCHPSCPPQPSRRPIHPSLPPRTGCPIRGVLASGAHGDWSRTSTTTVDPPGSPVEAGNPVSLFWTFVSVNCTESRVRSPALLQEPVRRQMSIRIGMCVCFHEISVLTGAGVKRHSGHRANTAVKIESHDFG